MTRNDRSGRTPAMRGRITPQPVFFSPDTRANLVATKARALLEQGTEIVPDKDDFLLYMRLRTLQDHLEAFEKARVQLERSTDYLRRRVNRRHREMLDSEPTWADLECPHAQPASQLVEMAAQQAG